jgi:hypothetical protein
MLEEQGVNVLYVALGELRYRERAGSAEFRHAPLLLLPVVLERKSARERFALKWNEEDPQENLSLREKLKAEFGFQLPEFPDLEDFDIADYFQRIRDASLAAGRLGSNRRRDPVGLLLVREALDVLGPRSCEMA